MAIWLDATSNVVADASRAYIEKWLDRREIVRDDMTTTNHPYAEANNRRNAFDESVYEAERRPNYLANGCDGKPVADFGPWGNQARWLHVVNSTDTPEWSILRARDVFAVCARNEDARYGHLISLSHATTVNGSPSWVASADYVWGDTENVRIDKGTTWLDGCQRPSSRLQVFDTDWHLLEGRLPLTTDACAINQIGLDRAMPKLDAATYGTSGGFRLAELIVFNHRLSEFERLRVQNYLQRKWGTPNAKSIGTLSTTTNVAVTVASAANVSGTLTGGGRVTKEGTGCLTVLNDGFSGTVELKGGSLRTDTAAVMAAQPGVTFDVNEAGVARTGSAASGTIAKTGEGVLTLASLPSETTMLAVEDGTLNLRLNETPQPLPALTTLQDGDFESYAKTMTSDLSQNVGGGSGTKTPQTNNCHWVFDRSNYSGGGNLVCILSSRTAQNNAGSWNLCPLDDAGLGYNGMALLYICHGSATGLFDVTEAGFYTLSFQVSSRSNNYHKEMKFLLDGAEQRRFKSYDAYEFMRYEIPLPYLARGSHTIAFSDVGDDANTVVIDDVKILPRQLFAAEPLTVSIINPGFELPLENASFTWSGNVINGTKPDSSLTTGWTMPTEGTTTFYMNQIVRRWDDRFSTDNNDCYKIGLCLQPEEMPEGFLCAQLHSTNVISQTVTFPTSGCYRLSYALAKRCAQAVQSVKVTVGEKTVGWHVVSHDAFRRYDVTFDIAEPGPQPLAFQGLFNRFDTEGFTNIVFMDGCAYLDDVALLRIGEKSENLLVNGDFEGTDGWTLHGGCDYAIGSSARSTFGNGLWQYNLTAGTKGRSNNWPQSNVRGPINGGNSVVLGTANGNNGAIRQVVSLEAGRYELSYRHAAAVKDPDCQDGGLFWVGVGPASGYSYDYLQRYPILPSEVPQTETVAFTVPSNGSYRVELHTVHRQASAVMLDDIVLRRAEAPKAVDLSAKVPTSLKVAVAKNAYLNLDFDGTAQVEEVRYNGRKVVGVISHARCPEWVMGRGELYAEPKGLRVIVR